MSDGASAAAIAEPTRERVVGVEIDGRLHEIRVHTTAPPWAELARRHRERRKGLTGESSEALLSPMQGVVLQVSVSEGAHVEAGDLICVVEAMKMENEISAHRSGAVTGLTIAPGEQVAHGQVICVLEGE